MATSSLPDPSSVGLPVRIFLYTIDQVAQMMSLTTESLHRGGYLHYQGVSEGAHKADLLKAVDVAPSGSLVHEWRVSEAEFIRWLKRKGFRVYSRGYAR